MTAINLKDFDMFSGVIPEWSIVLDTDSYKVSMWKQYPSETKFVSSYIEARGGRFPNTTFFGLQAFLKKLERRVTRQEVEFARMFWTTHGEPFNYDGWMYIVEKLDGRLPLLIDAIDEGSVVPVHHALLRITNSDPNCWWLPSWVETSLLRAIWYPTTVCTLSWTIKQIIRKALNETADDEKIAGLMPFRLHDFGSRGASSYETAMLGGAAHLVNFMGTDTAVGMLGAMFYYGAPMDPETGVSPGYSIPAGEHSTITSWGRECEVDAFSNMIDQFAGPGKIYAVVSDSYDIFKAAGELWGEKLRKKVQDAGGTLVVRPDSGDPTKVPLQIIEILGEKFGYTVNSKGYKVLADCARVIQGDGVGLDSIQLILDSLIEAGWSAENIAFGMGGALLQQPNRDTQKWAMKASAALVGDSWRDVFKDPITDPGKTSKKGRLGLVLQAGLGSVSYRTKRVEYIRPGDDLLLPRFMNGKAVNFTTFDEVRDRSNTFGTEIDGIEPTKDFERY
jgi:nicotinamide phosphoribosyltransferase